MMGSSVKRSATGKTATAQSRAPTPDSQLAPKKHGAAVGPGSGDEDAAVIFQQREIERLLDDGAAAPDLGEGMKAILSPALVSYERLPMLDMVFERLADRLAPSLRRFTGGAADVRLDKIASARFAGHLGSLPLTSMLAVVRAEQWHNQILLSLERGLVFAALDALLGNGQAGGRVPAEGRSYTTIEQNLMQRLLQLVLGELSAAFAPLTEVSFLCQRIESNPRFAAIARDVHATVVVSLKVALGGGGGRLELAIPYAALEPVRRQLLQSHLNENDAPDALWESHLTAALNRTEVTLQAVLAAEETTLGEVLQWTEGSRLLLKAGPETPVALRCGETPVFAGRLQRKPGSVAVEITAKAKDGEASS